jgi:hypothetical protein
VNHGVSADGVSTDDQIIIKKATNFVLKLTELCIQTGGVYL